MYKNEINDIVEIPIVFAVDDNYLKYAAVTIASIIDYKKENEKYFFYIIHSNISNVNRDKMTTWINKRGENCIFIDIKNIIKDMNFYISGTITEETYYRLFIPEILKEYDKVLYMDCDIICQRNIGELFQCINVEETDYWIAGTLAGDLDLKDKYCRENLGISSDTFIYAGMLVMNIKELRKSNFCQLCCDFIKEKDYLKQHDMDVVNAVCYGHIKVLDSKYHTTVGAIAKKKGKKVNDLNVDELDCHLIHYASSKPWATELSGAMLPFWSYVLNTPFENDILKEYDKISNVEKNIIGKCKDGKISFAFLLKCFIFSLCGRFKNR